ncbi:MAG: transcription-repair coupling factor [Planctomycetota bacterium]|nr:MAG: transcription-repair coupling factor [Planctomycetota bacterium]
MSWTETSLDRLRKIPSYRDLLQRWQPRKRVHWQWGGLWGSAKSALTASLLRDLDGPLLVITSKSSSAELAFDDLHTLGSGPVRFPAREGRMGVEPEVLRDRFHAMDLATRKGFRGILIAPLAALLQPLPPHTGGPAVLDLQQGMRLEPEQLMRQLMEAGFERVPAIQHHGEMAQRGDIVDFFPPSLGEPLRLEFFDDELESLRVFDLASQRTRHVLKQVKVPLTQELPPVAEADQPLPLEQLPKHFRVLRWEPAAIEDTAAQLRIQGKAYGAALDRVQKSLSKRSMLDLATLPGREGTLETLSVEEYCRGVAEGASLLAQRAADGEHVVVCCSTPAEADRLQQILVDQGHKAKALHLHQGGLNQGFRFPEARLTVLHHRELVPGHGGHRPKPRQRHHTTAGPLESVLSLKPGDLVVHAIHGLARFQGIEALADGQTGGEEVQDVLLLEFRDGANLQVPVARVDLVERYIGSGGATPALDRLGSGAFEKRRRKVESAVEDLASDMLSVQAKRMAQPGQAFEVDEEELRRFEASFPFEDTPDQAQSTRDIHQDLLTPRASDRLICGDVGYGKTELAARAAFRVILAGYQVALLVPTTVLAEQHTRSLRQRFADWPLQVEQLSRIVSPKKRRETMQALAKGQVDLVVGTHRLLSKDVRFSRLGLVIIDEEQRFGVRAKEGLKKKRSMVDVLTLSATPVPRTLHMALAGIRDISNLTTAPVGRLEVHTEIRYRDEDALLRQAMQEELARGGQIFYVHNRVKSLESMAKRLGRLVPEAKIVIGHGQMEPRELEKAMLAFVRGQADVLCSTTIVESGLDIPNANTIFIDEAHRYGLADLHQLRGRVGRSTQRGHCYLLIPRGQPLSLDARRRLKAVEELRYLGAGFQVAMRDLEIRGAGNLLGSEQSGHIAAVGYETYRRLLAQAVKRLKRQGPEQSGKPQNAADVNLGVVAQLPPTYVPDEEARLSVLREMDRIRDPAEVDAVMSSLVDRFGPTPDGVAALAKIFFLKHRLGALGFRGVQLVNDRLVCTIRDASLVEGSLDGTGADIRIITPKTAHWVLSRRDRKPAQALEHLYLTAAACRPRRRRGKSPARSSSARTSRS